MGEARRLAEEDLLHHEELAGRQAAVDVVEVGSVIAAFSPRTKRPRISARERPVNQLGHA